MSVSYAWQALRHRNFRLFFVGQGISLSLCVMRTAPLDSARGERLCHP
jgi:hypothetical protein